MRNNLGILSLKISKETKLFLCLGMVLTLLTIPNALIESFITEIFMVVAQLTNGAPEQTWGVMRVWASQAGDYSLYSGGWSPILLLFVVSLPTVLAVIYMIFYKKERLKLFLSIHFIIFIGYYVIFLWLILPNIEYFLSLSSGQFADSGDLTSSGLSGIQAVTSSMIFVVMAMWWKAGLPLVFFWLLTNQVVSQKQALWMYPAFIFFYFLGSSLGQVVRWVSSMMSTNDLHDISISNYSIAIVIGMLCAILPVTLKLIGWVEKLYTENSRDSPEMSKRSVGNKFRYLFSFVLVLLGYGVCSKYINDLSWIMPVNSTTSDLKTELITRFYSQYLIIVLLALAAIGVLRRLGWGRTILIPPIAIGILGVSLLSSLFFQMHSEVLSWLKIFTASSMTVLLWTFFTPTKQMAYQALPPITQARYMILLEILLPLDTIAKYVAGMEKPPILGIKLWSWASPMQIIIICLFWLMWIFGLKSLKKLYAKMTAEEVSA